MKPEECLENCKENKNNYNKLRTCFSKETFVAFVGAGPSTTLGCLEWDDLLEKMKKDLNINIKVPRSRDGVNYPKLFSRLFDKLNDRKRFFDTLFEKSTPTKSHYTAFHVDLIDTFDVCVTTNYDSPIEDAYKRINNRNIQKYYFCCYQLEELRDCVIYLHGHKDINFAIIREEDYDYFYPSVNGKNGIPILENFIEKLYHNKNILFLGFSFNDQYILKLFKKISKTPSKCEHFWILSDSTRIYENTKRVVDSYKKSGAIEKAEEEEKEFYTKFEAMKIKPIVYRKERYIFLEELFKELTEKPVIQATGSANLASVPEGI